MFPGKKFPNFTANSTEGIINFHEWLADSWGILCSHPADFTPVCTSELARLVTLMPEFTKRNVKVIGLSCDSVESHIAWSKDILRYAGITDGRKFPFPIIEDQDRTLANELAMIDRDAIDSAGRPLTGRAVYIIDKNKKLQLSCLYPSSTGRNFMEILCVVDSMQKAGRNEAVTPVDGQAGDGVQPESSASEDSDLSD